MTVGIAAPLLEELIGDGHGAAAGSLGRVQVALGAVELAHVCEHQSEVELIVDITGELGKEFFAERDRLGVGFGGVLGEVEDALDVGHLAVSQSCLANNGGVERALAEEALVELECVLGDLEAKLFGLGDGGQATFGACGEHPIHGLASHEEVVLGHGALLRDPHDIDAQADQPEHDKQRSGGDQGLVSVKPAAGADGERLSIDGDGGVCEPAP